MSGEVLSFLLGAEDDTLREFAADSETGRLGKTLVKDGPLRITLVALKKGTVLSSHQVAGPVSIQTLRGCLRLTTDRGDMDLPRRLDRARPRGCPYGKSPYRLRDTHYIRDA
jgi:quercetin dioxygenase-like cupin family protein